MTVARVPVRVAGFSKYHATPTVVDGVRFDSHLEARHYSQLRLLQRIGSVLELERQPVFDLVVGGCCVARYIADFRVVFADGEIQIRDCKGVRTPVYRLKRKLFEALYPFRIVEIIR